MTRKPSNVSWLGFDDQQRRILDTLDQIGNNGWDSNGQTDEMMPALLARAAASDLPLHRIKEAMGSVGYTRADLHQLDRWESKRLTGRFGK